MKMERTQVGREVEAALSEVLAHVRGEVDLPCRIVDDPAAERILALRKRLGLSRQKFADRFGVVPGQQTRVVPPIYLIRGASRTPTGPPALVMAPSSL